MENTPTKPNNPSLPTTSTTSVSKAVANVKAVSTVIHPKNGLIEADIYTMMQFITKRGINLPTTIKLTNIDDDSVLITNYNTMIDTIKPATVQSINYINKQILNEEGEDRKWHQTPILAKCLLIAGLALIALIVISLSPQVNEQNQAAGLLTSSGKTLLFNLIFICSSSLLGVMFYLLKTISDKIKNYTLLPIDAIEINSAIIIGVISGFIISELFTFSTSSISTSIEMQKMTLALLGGFSSDAIFSILKGVITKAKALFSSSGDS